MSKYARGPWEVEIGDDGRPSGIAQAENGWNVCTFPHTAWKGAANRPMGREKILSNARLIAAAPDLLAVAIDAVLYLKSSDLEPSCKEVIERLNQAIAKAEGKEKK